MQVLHITAHLGGGVGKALSGLVVQASLSDKGVKHYIVCLEKPEKSQFVDLIFRCGGKVIVCPSIDLFKSLMKDSDVVQLEWWNHPALAKYLCPLSVPPIRLLTWSHVSGLHTPIIPKQLILASHIFLFTSCCSFEGKEVVNLPTKTKERLGVVSSSGGFSGLPEACSKANEKISVGYIGSLNFAKLHPRYIDYLAAVRIPEFKVKIIGDLLNKDALDQQCEMMGRAGMLEYTGFVSDVASELEPINVLAYLLNPDHYGTTENALLESMSMGIVPIVLDNPPERQIIDDCRTGLIVHSPDEFAEAIQWLSENPVERQKLGIQAANSVRERFSVEKMESSLNRYYRKMISMEKRKIDFSEIFGTDPAEWFLSSQGDSSIFAQGGSIHIDNTTPLSHGLFEQTKGSVFHFSEYFPDNFELDLWAKNLKLLQ